MVAVTLLSWIITLLVIGYGLISTALKPCGPLDNYLNRSNCLRVLRYSYFVSTISSISFSPDGRFIAGGGLGGDPKLWEVNSGELLNEFHPRSGGMPENVTFSPDGQTIAFAQNYTSNTLTLADPQTGAILFQLRGLPPIRDITYSPDGATLAIISVGDSSTIDLRQGDKNDNIDLRQVSNGQLLQSFPIDNDADVRKVAFSVDGQKLLAIADHASGYEVYSWNVSDGILVDKVPLAANNSLGIAFSPDRVIVALGNCIQMGEWDCAKAEVTLWQISSGQLLHRLDVAAPHIYDLAFSADGTLLASTPSSGNIQIWDVREGTLLNTIEEHPARVSSIAFSPQGKILAIGSADVTLWEIE